MNQERGFAGYFSEQCVQLSIQVKPIPGEAHNQASQFENQQKIWKTMAYKAIDEKQLIGDADMDSLAVSVNCQKNTLIRRAGFSPYMWTFGKEITLPESIINQPDNVQTHSLINEDDEVRRRMEIRNFAAQAFYE